MKLYNLLMVVKANRVVDSSSWSRKDVGVHWLEREMCQRQPTGISALMPLTAKHQQDWKASLKSLAVPDTRRRQLQDPTEENGH